MPSAMVTRIHETLFEAGYTARDIQLGIGSEPNETPHLVLNQGAYPGAEAHLFTIADSALWVPILTSGADIVLYRPKKLDEGKHVSIIEENRYQAWENLLNAFKRMSDLLTPYRNRLADGYLPSDIWTQYATEWFRKIREAPEPEPRPASEFIHYVDASIRTHIQTLNECGFSTIESCSGLPKDHPDREPYSPYVMFSERAYIGVSAHLFTLADIARWIPGCAPHRFDIVIRQRIGDDVDDAWNRLMTATQELSHLLEQYRELIRGPMLPFKRIRKKTQMSDGDVQEFLGREHALF